MARVEDLDLVVDGAARDEQLARLLLELRRVDLAGVRRGQRRVPVNRFY